VINDITEQTNLLALNAAIEGHARARRDAGCGCRRRSPQAGGALPERDERHCRINQGHPSETNEAVVVMEEARKKWSPGQRWPIRRPRAGRDFQRGPQSAELVQNFLASKQQCAARKGVAHAMQIISNITRQTSQAHAARWQR